MAIAQIYGVLYIINPAFIEETSSYWFSILVQFFSVFHWLSSIGKPHITPVSFSKTTESFEVSLIIISRQTSYDSDIIRQYYGKLRNHTSLADGLYEVCRKGHDLGSTFTETDRNGRAKLLHWTKLCEPCIAAIAGSKL